MGGGGGGELFVEGSKANSQYLKDDCINMMELTKPRNSI